MKQALVMMAAVCGIAEALGTLRPGAQWALHGDDYAGIQWIDQSQSKPTKAQVASAVSDCLGAETTRKIHKAQARFAVRSSTATATQKINALILLMDLDS